jgi:hypothetical protein
VGQLYRASQCARKAAEEAFAGGAGRRRQANELKGLDDGPACPGKPASPAVDVKGDLPNVYTCGRVKARMAGDARAEVQKELFPSLAEAQDNILSYDYESHSAAATRSRTRVAVRLQFGHQLGRILAQRTLARDGAKIFTSGRARVAKVL